MLFKIRISRTFVLLLFVVHLLAIISVCLTNLVFWARASLALLIVASLIHQLYLHLRAKHVWRSFSLNQKQLVINTLGGEALNGELMHQTVVTPHCVVLCARVDERKRPVCQVIFRDAMQTDAFRELRVRLKFV